MKYLLIFLLAIMPSALYGATLGVSYDNGTRNVLQTDLNYTGATANFTASLKVGSVDVVPDSRTITINGTTGEITSSAGAQSLAVNRTWTISLPSLLILTGKTLTNGTFVASVLTTPTIASFVNATHTHQNAAGGGTLDAAAIAAGTIATARLGSGTANNTTFLRGDQTWATPAGSGDVTAAANITDGAPVVGDGGAKGIKAATGDVTFPAAVIATTSVTAGAATGVGLTGSNGTLTFLGLGDGQDEDMKADFNSTANTAVWTSTTGMATWDFGTSWVFKLGTVELGHATDTTISRNAAGFASVEGKPIASPASAVAGDVMYFDGTQWVRLAKGTAGQVLEMNAGATAPEWDTDDGGGAPTDADYLVGTANGSLSAEIVVGTSPGGELGGTWASPTIDDSLAVTSWTLTTPVLVTKVQLPTAAGSSTLTTGGDSAVNTTDKQIGVHNGTKEVAIPLTRRFPFTFDPKAICDGTFDGLFLFTVTEPFGITITSWRLSFEADPTTEVDLDLKRADAFIGRANSAVMDVVDTTAGVSSEATAANINGGAVVANGKVVYLEFGTAYSEANHQMIFEITYEIEED